MTNPGQLHDFIITKTCRLAVELSCHTKSHLPLTQPSPPLNVMFLSITATPLLNSSREGTQPLAWAACSNGGQPFQWRNTSWYPTWTSPGANWGHFLSSCHLLPGRWGWHPPHYNLLSGLVGSDRVSIWTILKEKTNTSCWQYIFYNPGPRFKMSGPAKTLSIKHWCHFLVCILSVINSSQCGLTMILRCLLI